MGLGEPVPISASHGEGLVDLHDAMLAAAKAIGLDEILIGKTSDVDDDDVLTDSDIIEEKLDSGGSQLTYGKMKRLFSQCELLLLVARIWENQR